MAQTTYKSVTIIAAILVVACFVVGYFITIPAWNSYTQGKAVLANANTDNQDLKESLTSLQGFLDSVKSDSNDVTLTSLALPVNSPDTANLVASIDSLAKSSGVVLSNFSLAEVLPTAGAISAKNSIVTVTVSLSATGSYASFQDFVSRLENNLRIFDLGHVTFKTTGSAAIQADINFNTYYQR